VEPAIIAATGGDPGLALASHSVYWPRCAQIPASESASSGQRPSGRCCGPRASGGQWQCFRPGDERRERRGPRCRRTSWIGETAFSGKRAGFAAHRRRHCGRGLQRTTSALACVIPRASAQPAGSAARWPGKLLTPDLQGVSPESIAAVTAGHLPRAFCDARAGSNPLACLAPKLLPVLRRTGERGQPSGVQHAMQTNQFRLCGGGVAGGDQLMPFGKTKQELVRLQHQPRPWQVDT
jgi:hypothetical protein